MSERKLELVLYSVYVGAVMLMILLIWQFFLGPLYEAENKNFNAHFMASAAAGRSGRTLHDFLKMPENDNYSIAGKNWTTIPNSSIVIPCCPSPWYPTEESEK